MALVELERRQVEGGRDDAPVAVVRLVNPKVNAIVTTGPTRAVQFPEVPTVREAGFPQLEAPSWTAWFAPSGTPDAIVRRLNGELGKVLNNAEFKQKTLEGGHNPLVHASPEEVAEQVKQGLAKWGPLVKSSGIKLD